jgi:hypothetical protein
MRSLLLTFFAIGLYLGLCLGIVLGWTPSAIAGEPAHGAGNESAMADRFAECSVFFNSMSLWPGMTREASLQMAELADQASKHLVEFVDGETAATKLDTANHRMWAPYADNADDVSPDGLIAAYGRRCATLLSQAD